jgi:hypothetical protein
VLESSTLVAGILSFYKNCFGPARRLVKNGKGIDENLAATITGN